MANLQKFRDSTSSGHLYSSLIQKLALEGRHVHSLSKHILILSFGNLLIRKLTGVALKSNQEVPLDRTIFRGGFVSSSDPPEEQP